MMHKDDLEINYRRCANIVVVIFPELIKLLAACIFLSVNIFIEA